MVSIPLTLVQQLHGVAFTEKLIHVIRQIFLYAGVALAQAGLDDALAEQHLRDGAKNLGVASYWTEVILFW